MASSSYVIDLRSDTFTLPTESMKKAMVTSPLGDDVYGEDPTVNALESKVATLLGKQAALFVPSGTMSNLLAIMVHCNRRGSELLVGDECHVFKYEQGGAAHVAGVMVTTLKNKPDGTFDLTEFESRIRGADIHSPLTSLVIVENTHNMCGGKVIPMDWIEKLSVLAKKHNILMHMDGARLFNASEYMGEPPAKLVKDFDSISICFSKSLGAPTGSALVGSLQFINQARRFRKMLGGGMRQAGVLAAPAIVALDEIVPALCGDHRRAKYIANAIAKLKLPSFSVDVENQHTNIIMLKIDPNCAITSDLLEERLLQVSLSEVTGGCKTPKGEGITIKVVCKDPKTVRFVLYFSITDDDVKLAVEKLSFVLKEMESNKNGLKRNPTAKSYW